MTQPPLPNFLCVGAQKAGTTSLFHMLNRHPDIYAPKKKEAHFFDWDERFNKGLEWYRKTFFSDWNEQSSIGTITPSYLYLNHVPARLLEVLGSELKLIFIFRHPICRAFSHYTMTCARGIEDLDFEQALAAESDRLRIGEHEKAHFSYVTRGLYSEQLNRYMKLFPREKMLFLIFEEDIVVNQAATFEKVQDFLNVAHVPLAEEVRVNTAEEWNSDARRTQAVQSCQSTAQVQQALPERKRLKAMNGTSQIQLESPPPLSTESRNRLMQQYFPREKRSLEQLIRRDLSVWD